MNTTTLIGLSAALASAVLANSSALAFESTAGMTTAEGSGFIGLGVAYAPDYEGGDDYEVIPAPFGHYTFLSGRSVDLSGTSGTERAARLKADIISDDWSEMWQAGPVLQYRLKRDSVDDSKVKKMKDVDAAIEAGAFVGFSVGRWAADLTFAGDVSSEYDGYLVYLDGDYTWPINDKLALIFGAHATWADSNYMETYFGVDRKDAARSGLKRYDPDSGIKDAGLTLSARYSFTESWGLLGVVGYTRMLNDAEDSPLVNDRGDKNQYNGILAVTYSF